MLCVLQLAAALLGWHSPELLPLAMAIRKQQQQHHLHKQQQLSESLLSFIAAGLLPAVGRHDELSRNDCVTGGAYKEALKACMRDEVLLQQMSKDVVRHLALTYWYQVTMCGLVGSAIAHCPVDHIPLL